MTSKQQAAPERVWLQLDALTFDARLQMRDFGGTGKDRRTVSQEWVDSLAEMLDDGAEFEPLEAVKEDRGGKKQPVYWVWHGFHRGAAHRRHGTASVEVLVTPGTFADAQFLALSANGKQPLRRTEADCRRAFDTLLDTPHLKERVLARAGGAGGIHRAIALACSISKGAVGKYLEARGLKADRKSGQLVPIEAPPARASEPDPDPEPPALEPLPEPVAVAPVEPQMGSDYLRRVERQRIERAVKLVGEIGKEFEELTRAPKSTISTRFVQYARMNGVPVETKSREVPVPGAGFATEREEYHVWPVLAAVRATLCDLLAVLAQEEVSA